MQKSLKNDQKRDMKQPKKGQKRNLQNPLFLDTPNWIFISGPGCMGTLKNLVKIMEISPKKLLKLLMKRSQKVKVLHF
jgi:hypothetical protein